MKPSLSSGTPFAQQPQEIYRSRKHIMVGHQQFWQAGHDVLRAIFQVIYYIIGNFSKSGFNSVGRAEDCSCLTDILRSLVRIRQAGIINIFFACDKGDG